MISNPEISVRKITSLSIDGYQYIPIMHITTRRIVGMKFHKNDKVVQYKSKLHYELYDKALKIRLESLKENIENFSLRN